MAKWAESSAELFMRGKIDAWNEQVAQLNKDVAAYKVSAESAIVNYSRMQTALKTAEDRFKQTLSFSKVIHQSCSIRLIEVLSKVTSTTMVDVIAALRPFSYNGLPSTSVAVEKMIERLLKDKDYTDPFTVQEVRIITKSVIHRDLRVKADEVWRNTDKVSKVTRIELKLMLKIKVVATRRTYCGDMGFNEIEPGKCRASVR